MVATTEEEEVISADPKWGESKGAKTLRFPKHWTEILGGYFKRNAPIKAEWCKFHGGWHVWFVPPGEQMPLCPEASVICPCGCGKEFRYERREQVKLRQARHDNHQF